MDSYGKLVRDRIPQIIRADGTEPVTCTAEFLEADGAGALEEVRRAKVDERGGFADRQPLTAAAL